MDFLDDDTIYPMINEQRCLKKEKELKQMQEAVDISCKAHIECMKICQPYLYEYQIAGFF